jgi:radical SAM protein with 4Fe4S-binding SPASM domain
MCYFWGETGCYSTKYLKSKPKTLEFHLIKKLINDLKPAKPWYSLFGGEPLLYPQFEELIREIKKAGSYVDTPTNGTLISANAKMLVQTGFDSVRVSIDGTKSINDLQRGKGSFERAMQGILDLHQEKKKFSSNKPSISIIYTITPQNYNAIEEFLLKDLKLEWINGVTIQMQNFLTKEMGENYSQFLKREFEVESDQYWSSMVRSPDEFSCIDTVELSRQVQNIHKELSKKNKNILLLPPTFSPRNLHAYLNTDWKAMEDKYKACYSPFLSTDIVANGDVAPCHIFYDLVMGNLHEQSIREIWTGNRYTKFKKLMKENTFMAICKGCCILYLSGKKIRKKNLNFFLNSNS